VKEGGEGEGEREGERGLGLLLCHSLGPVRNRYFHTGWRPVFPGSSRLEIEPKTPGWLVQDPSTSPAGIWDPGRGSLLLFINAVPNTGLDSLSHSSSHALPFFSPP
jgi:hypothetical protein